MQFPESVGNSSVVTEVKLGLMLFLANTAVAMINQSTLLWENGKLPTTDEIGLNLNNPADVNFPANETALQTIDHVSFPELTNSSHVDSHDITINSNTVNSRIMDRRKFIAFETFRNSMNLEEDGLSRLKVPMFCTAVVSLLFGVLLFVKRVVQTQHSSTKDNDEENLIVNGDDVMYLPNDDGECEKNDLMFSQALFRDCECDCYRQCAADSVADASTYCH